MGLFAHYPATPGSLEAAGDDLDRRAEGLSAFGRGLRRATAPADANVSGILLAPVRAAPLPVQRQATSLARAALVAAGAVTVFGHDVTDFNTTIDGLNRRWDAGVATDFGVDKKDLPPGASQREQDQADDDFAADVAAARAALLRQLRKEHGLAEDALDRDADRISRLLDKGPTEEVALALFRAGGLPAAALPLFPGVDLRGRDLAAMRRALDRYGGADEWTRPQGATAAELAEQLAVVRGLGIDPSQYRDLVQWRWATQAAEKAGIDLTGWDTSLGANGLKSTIEDVYTYYGKLYGAHPWMQWAGMANMIGPSFAAGFFDLASYRRFADAVGGIPDWARPFLPPGLKEADILADLSAEDIKFYETTLLDMQKEIFFDQASMHEAYLTEGMDGIWEMHDSGVLGQGGEADSAQALNAWYDIDTGLTTNDPDLLQKGNEALLYREQRYIIEDQYQDMKNHLPTGPAVTYFMGALGQPSIPGAQSLGEHNPVVVHYDSSPDLPGPFPNPIPGVKVDITTPFPDGNIADFDTRWDLISNDTLPAYQDLLKNDPERAADIIGSNVSVRIDDQRMNVPIDELIDFLESGWDVDVSVGW